jgi:diguanylate cyclase (GGDEF)-like protein
MREAHLEALVDLAERGMGTMSARALSKEALVTACALIGASHGAFLERVSGSRWLQVVATVGDEWTLDAMIDAGADPTKATMLPAGAAHGHVSTTTVEVVAGPQRLGLLVMGGVAGEPDEHDRQFLERVARCLGLSLQRRRVEGVSRHDALHDRLTGLPNRARFVDLLGQALAEMSPSSAVGLLFIDVDDFKLVNDTLDHAAGDELLIGIAARLCASVRATDVVGRFAGDEFMVLLGEVENEAEATAVAARIQQAMTIPLPLRGREMVVSVSIGVVTEVHGNNDPDRMLAAADAAMYDAKRSGRGGSAVFGEDLRAEAAERLSLVADLRGALSRDELEVWMQPIVDLPTMTVCGAEALLRWRHPTLGLVAPDRFIGLAEEFGLIESIGAWVLQEAMYQAARWPGALRVAVNVSARQVSHDLLATVDQALAATKLAPARLCIELTESTFMSDKVALREVIVRLRSKGIRISIDDFGTGYSSLGRLRALPFDVLKVDRSFVQDADTDEGARTIIEAVVALGRVYGAEVVAEGIETVEEHAAVAALGCGHAQGYLFGRPVPAAEFFAQVTGTQPLAHV